MFETIAMFGGIIGGVISLLAIIVFFLLKKNIVDILNKDAILFDKNFEIKQKTITESMQLIDELSKQGKILTLDEKFEAKAKACYNNLLCVATNVKLADEFYALAIDKEVQFNETRLAEFKLYCRKDIGFKCNKTLLVSRTKTSSDVGPNEAMMRANAAGNTNTNIYYENTAMQSPTNIQQPVQQPIPQPNPQQSQFGVNQAAQPIRPAQPINNPTGNPKQ